MSKIRVVLIEARDLSRVGLSAALQQVEEIEVVGDAANAKEGLQVLQSTQPDVAIIGLNLPDMDGIKLTQQYKKPDGCETAPDTKVLILTTQEREESVLTAFAAGADSYSLKDISLEMLVQAIQETNEGNAWIDPAIAHIILSQARKSGIKAPGAREEVKQIVEIEAAAPEYQQILETNPLTERELEVLELIVAGCSNADISASLHITVGTVKTHVRNILNKLCADDRTQAAVRALRAGLVD